MTEKPAPADTYSDEEADRRMDATVRAMIATPPKPQRPLTSKAKTRPASKGRVHKGRTKR